MLKPFPRLAAAILLFIIAGCSSDDTSPDAPENPAPNDPIEIDESWEPACAEDLTHFDRWDGKRTEPCRRCFPKTPCNAVHEPMRHLYARPGPSPGCVMLPTPLWAGHVTPPLLPALSPPHHDRDEHDTSQKGEEVQGNCPGKSRRSSALGAAVGKSPPRSEMR